MRRLALILAAAIVVSPHLLFAQGNKPMTPTAPGLLSSDPTWQGAIRLSDGRTFVTDGGFAIDAAIAKPAKLPDKQFPSKVFEDYLKAPQKDTCRLGDLTGTMSGKSYKTPSGVALNSTYVNYLRRTLPARSVRLLTTTASQPVLIESDGKLVGVMMPIAQ